MFWTTFQKIPRKVTHTQMNKIKGNDPMLYVPLLCLKHLCINKCPFLIWISIEKELHNVHHLTAVSTADLVTCSEHLAFWFYKYHQNYRSSVVSSITPTWVVSLLLCFWSKRQQKAPKNMIISRDMFTKQVSEKPIPLTMRS